MAMNMSMNDGGTLLNFVNGKWQRSSAAEMLDVTNPATAQVIGQVPLSPGAEVDAAAQAAQQAFISWRRVPITERIQHLFKFKALLEENLDAITRIIFPGMIPLWFMPYALAAGNCFILKPSEKVPGAAVKLFELLEQAGFPVGVVQLVTGGKETVDAFLDHPVIKAVSFVGSTPVARYIYSRATANGKRAQCQGGAKNPVVILPDADMEMTTRIMADSAFGCAGQRCLAASVAITVGDARSTFTEMIADAATSRSVGYGLDKGVQMGPVIT